MYMQLWPQKEKRKIGDERKKSEIITDNFSKLVKDYKSADSRISTNFKPSKHEEIILNTVVKLLKHSDKGKTLKVIKEERNLMYSETEIKMKEKFSLKTVQVGRQSKNFF